MKLTFCGANQTATGSKHLLELQSRKILVDCGIFQGKKELRVRNWEKPPFIPSELKAVILTHAHLDHSGYLPILVRMGFKGPIYTTEATRDLCEILLRDAGRINEEDAFRANKYGYSKHKPALPLYTEKEAIETLRQFKTYDFGRDLVIDKDITVTASHAGHILGAAILSFRINGTTIVFSGDIGRLNDPVMREPAEIQTADYLILESTYGNRKHPDEDAALELAKAINATANRGGMTLIPAFAVGRTQKILYLLYKLKESGAIPDLPVYLDSPMAQDATDLMKHHLQRHKLPAELCTKVCHIAEYVRSPEESKALNKLTHPSIIISASGMLDGGRVLHHVKHLAPGSRNTIVFVGFQAPMTRGEKILQGFGEVKIHESNIPIRCKILSLESLSSHGDYSEILSWLRHFRCKPKVFLTHGEPEACIGLKEQIQEEFGWNVKIPSYLESVEL